MFNLTVLTSAFYLLKQYYHYFLYYSYQINLYYEITQPDTNLLKCKPKTHTVSYKTS